MRNSLIFSLHSPRFSLCAGVDLSSIISAFARSGTHLLFLILVLPQCLPHQHTVNDPHSDLHEIATFVALFMAPGAWGNSAQVFNIVNSFKIVSSRFSGSSFTLITKSMKEAILHNADSLLHLLSVQMRRVRHIPSIVCLQV